MRKELVFAIHMTPQGPSMELGDGMNAGFVLRLLASVMEDMRQKLSVDAALAAMKAEMPRVEIVPANGVHKIG